MKTRLLAVLLTLLIFASCAPAEEVTVTILETSDLHGSVYSHDYSTDRETSNTGLARVASYVKEQRALDPELLLLDCGDTIQGNMIFLFNEDEVHPMVAAMNLMDYDAWNLGNHEFNYDFSVLSRAVAASGADVLLGNAYREDGAGMENTKPYVIYTVKGVKVGVFGITAPHIDLWEASSPEHYDYMAFRAPEEQTALMAETLRSQVDVLIGLVHYGSEGEYGAIGMKEVAAMFPQVDAFLLGHTHDVLAEENENGTVLLEPGSSGSYVSKLTFTLKKQKGGYDIVAKSYENADMENFPPDAELLDAMRYVHDYSVKDANTVVGCVTADYLDQVYGLPGIPVAQLEDTALIDLINEVQLYYSGADVSMASLFSADSNLLAGDFKKKDSVNIYQYENTLKSVRVSGAQLKAIMEKFAGEYFNGYRQGDVTISFNPDIRIYNYDMFAGIDYEIDISKPVGERIVNLVYKGEPLKDDEELVLAMNSYRCSDLCATGMVESENLVFDSEIALTDITGVRDLISAFVAQRGEITPHCDHNWRIVGADLDDPQKELIYEMIERGELTIPASEDGRTPNVRSINAIELRAQGILPPL